MANRLWAVPFLLISSMTIADDGSLSTAIDTLKCPELAEAANKAAMAHRAVGNAASEQISSGESLKNRTCLDDMQGFKFDFFETIPSLSGTALKTLREKVVKQITSMACDATNEVINAGNKVLTCNAAIGVKLDGSAGFESLDVSECGGLDLEHDIDGGSHNIGSGNTTGGSIGANATGTNRGSPGDEEPKDTTAKSWSNWIQQ